MAEDKELFRFQLDSEVSIYDNEALLGWIIEQVGKNPTRFDYIKGWQDPVHGGDPQDVVVERGRDAVTHLNDPVSSLELVTTLLINSIPGLEEVGGHVDVEPYKYNNGLVKIRFDSRICIDDDGGLFGWILEQTDAKAGFEFVQEFQDPELGGKPEPAIIYDGGEGVFLLEDPVSTLQLVAWVLMDSIPGVVEEGSNDLSVDRIEARTD